MKETNTMKIKSNCMFLSRLNISKHLGHFPSSLQWKCPECVRLVAQSAKSSTFLPRFLRLLFGFQSSEEGWESTGKRLMIFSITVNRLKRIHLSRGQDSSMHSSFQLLYRRLTLTKAVNNSRHKGKAVTEMCWKTGHFPTQSAGIHLWPSGRGEGGTQCWLPHLETSRNTAMEGG
ncbi:hypothetical protein EK904_000593 [Melospiza melodia maxima]|nr:hypothetical protein EK904_000593 [Melospiza melodia maxima]